MDVHKYDFEIDLSNLNNAHTHMIDMIGGNKRVLEMGCATGYMSKVLAQRGCRVFGVEINPEAASKAKEYCEDVVVGDIESLDFTTIFGPTRFDVVVFGDVLEHLRDPLSVLRGVRPVLVVGGYVIASIPNVAHGAVRLQLLEGRFDYRPLGLLDETHLKLFTRGSIKKLFEDSGLALTELRRTVTGIFETEIPVRREDFSAEILEQIAADPESTTYQFIVKAVLDDGSRAIQELHEREENQRAEIQRLEKEIEGLQARLEAAVEEENRLKGAESNLIEKLVTSQEALSTVASALRRLEDRWARLESRWLVRLYRWFQRSIQRGKRG